MSRVWLIGVAGVRFIARHLCGSMSSAEAFRLCAKTDIPATVPEAATTLSPSCGVSESGVEECIAFSFSPGVHASNCNDRGSGLSRTIESAEASSECWLSPGRGQAKMGEAGVREDLFDMRGNVGE